MKVLIAEEQLREGVRRIAQQIQQRYQGRPLTVVGVLTSSLVFLSDLIRQLDIPLRVELIPARAGARNGGRPGPLVINLDLLAPDVRDRDVLVVDDIFDTGHTVWELIPQLDELGPNSVRTAVLLRKQGRRAVPVEPDFVGFDIADVFVVGYGIDYADRYRNLPYVAVLEDAELGRGSKP